MAWVIKDEHCSLRIDDTIVSKLKTWVSENKPECQISLELVQPYFWLTIEQSNNLSGPMGVEGPNGATDCLELVEKQDTRPAAEPRDVEVAIIFRTTEEDTKVLETSKLVLTKNPRGQSLHAWHFQSMDEPVKVCRGIYKRPGFDQAYEAMKVCKPNLTPESFCSPTTWDHDTNWDEDLVSVEPFHGHEDCIKTFSKVKYVPTGKTKVVLSLLAVDVEPNFEFLKTLLSAFV